MKTKLLPWKHFAHQVEKGKDYIVWADTVTASLYLGELRNRNPNIPPEIPGGDEEECHKK